MNVDTRITGLDQLQRDMRTLAEHAKDMKPVWRQFRAEVWDDRQRKQFNSPPLAPLSRHTTKYKRVNATRPMVDTGIMRMATTQYSPFNDTRGEADFGIPKNHPRHFVAVIHLKTKTVRDVVPQLTPAEREKFRDILRRYLLKAWDSA